MSECRSAISVRARRASTFPRIAPGELICVHRWPCSRSSCSSVGTSSHAQEDAGRAVRWSFRLEPADAAPGNEADLILTATLAPHWVLYSSDFKAELGPQPVRLVAARNTAASTLLGPLRSIDARRKRDATFDVEYGYFADHAELRQRVRLPADGTGLAATLRGQACHEADGTCHLIREEIRIAAR